MIPALTLLLACQLAGEALVRALGVAFPGPVAGLFLLLGLLAWRGRRRAALGEAGEEVPEALDRVSALLLGNLSLLFVPAAVGIVQHAGLLRAQGFAILASIVVSTAAAMVVTALVFARLARGTRA